jgi:hypothetical protein
MLILRQLGHASILSAPAAFRPLLTEGLAFSGFSYLETGIEYELSPLPPPEITLCDSCNTAYVVCTIRKFNKFIYESTQEPELGHAFFMPDAAQAVSGFSSN